MSKRNIYLMYLIACLQGMIFYGPIATLYRQAQGISILEITVIESISLALCLILELPWGVLADKIGYRRTMIVCCILYFISKLIFWQATDFSAFLLERILLSVVIAGLSGVDTSILYLSCPPEKSQQVFGLYDSLGTAGLMAASLIYSAFIGDDYRLAGFLTAVTYGIAALLALLLKEVKRPDAASELTSSGSPGFFCLLKAVLKNPYLLLFLIGIAFFNETHQTVTVFLNQLQYTRCGLNSSVIGYIYIFATAIGFCSVFSSRLTKKLGTAVFMKTCFLCAALACLCLTATSHAFLSVAAIFLLRAVFSLVQPLQMQLQNEQIFTQNRATMLSINAIIIDSIGVATNLCFGRLAESSLTAAFLLGAALCLTSLVFFSVWQRRSA